jgi:hypothetical protein
MTTASAFYLPKQNTLCIYGCAMPHSDAAHDDAQRFILPVIGAQA